MGDPNTLDAGVLAPYLEAEVRGFSGFERIEKFSTGQSNPTYLIRARSGRYVLRAKPTGQLLKSAHQVDREYRVMKALSGTPVPVPAILHLSGEASPLGRMFYVMQFIEGRIFWNPALPEMADNQARAAIYDAMNRTLADLHTVDLDATELADFGPPGSYFERQLARWSSQYRACETVAIPDMDRLIGWLERHLPPDDGQTALVHGDFRLDNLVFAAERPDIVAVLDWELSTVGHPYADLAYQCMQWRLPHDLGDLGLGGLGGLDRARIGIPREADYVQAYCARRAIDGIPGWNVYLAFSFFRLAAICQGVYKRALDGNASNPERGIRHAHLVPMLASLAAKLIDEGE